MSRIQKIQNSQSDPDKFTFFSEKLAKVASKSAKFAKVFLISAKGQSLGLMTAVTFQLGQASLIDLPTVIIFALSAVLLFRFKANSTWLIIGGALAGTLTSLLK